MPEAIAAAARLIDAAERPVLLLGMLASRPAATAAVRALLAKARFAVVGTYQAAGVVPRERLDCFGGRVGLFHNQPADRLLDAADLVVTIGFDPVEYDPALWNRGRTRTLVHIDCVPADIDRDYRPDVELLGDIAATLQALAGADRGRGRLPPRPTCWPRSGGPTRDSRAEAADHAGCPSIRCGWCTSCRACSTRARRCARDMGSFHIWMARHLVVHRPRQIMISNGQQTLGVALPWAIAACLADPGGKVISISGDGGFLFSAVELETAVRLKCNFVHLVWIDGSYNMVGIQQIAAYGRDAAVHFGPSTW